MVIEAARDEDMTIVRECIARFRLDGERLETAQFIVARDGDRVVAFGRIKPYQQVHELGSVAVLEEERGKGYARLIVEELVRRFPSREVWITTDRPEVFSRLGFHPVDQAPEEIEAKLGRVCGWKPGVVAMLRLR